MDDDIESQPGGRVSGGAPFEDLSEVLHSGQAQKAAGLVERGVDLREREPGNPAQVSAEGGIDVAGAGAHDEPLQGGETHRRVDRVTIADRCRAAPVAEVEDDEVGVGHWSAEQDGRAPGHVADGRPVKAITPDPELLAPLGGHGIRVGGGRDALVEGGVEDRDLGHVREGRDRGVDAEQRGGVVQGRQRDEVVDGRTDLVGDDHRVAEPRPTVDDSMADGQQIGEDVALQLDLVERQPEGSPVIGDPFDQALDQGGLGVDVDELVLQRRGAGIDDEDERVVASHDCAPPAWTAVIAMVLTMSRTSAPRDRSLTGRPSPWRTGPMATAWALRWTAL